MVNPEVHFQVATKDPLKSSTTPLYCLLLFCPEDQRRLNLRPWVL
ncbi:hypothetical protein Nmel_009783, partial [Mimus melanotis]